MVFAGGAIVFPGGRVDPGDRVLAARSAHLDPDDAAARVAAIRETIEEAGMSVGITGTFDIDAMRAALASDADFATLLDEGELTLDVDRLEPFARWCPNFKETRTFDTRFFLARVEPEHAEASVDATENVHLFWARAADVLAMADAGDVKIIFPTRRNLERLVSLASFDAACLHARTHPTSMITPWIEERGGDRHLCIPDTHGYPVTSERLEGAMRT